MRHVVHESKKKDIMIKYDATAEGYDELYRDEQYAKYAKAAEALAKTLSSCRHSPSCRLCDIGCGTGLLIEYMAEAGLPQPSHYICIDLSINMLRHAKQRSKRHAAPLIDIIQGDAEHLPLRRKTCRIAVSFTVIDLVEDPARMLSECDHVSGTCIVSRLKKAMRNHSRELRVGSYLAETDKDIVFIRQAGSAPGNNTGKNP